jgi:hypothetical protein
MWSWLFPLGLAPFIKSAGKNNTAEQEEYRSGESVEKPAALGLEFRL